MVCVDLPVTRSGFQGIAGIRGKTDGQATRITLA